ncbi:MAG: hypothetical protein FIA98_11995 [Anaerolineae bacterium]|nr:hypothetical protein [Anaerolineae bacterium]
MSRIKPRFTIEHLWGVVVLIGIFMFVNTHPIRPYDFWWHIAVGKEIVETASIPTTDVYSFTAAGQPYPSYQMFWLMEIILYSIYKAGGPALVVFFQSLLITGAYGVLFYICKQASNSWRISALSVLFAAALGLNDWNVRPQGITFLLASLILLAIYEYRRRPHLGWLLLPPVCLLIWANSHGTFIIGLTLLGIWWGDEIWRVVWSLIRHEAITDWKKVILPGATLLISALACLLNPQGFGIIDYLRTLTGNSVVQNLVTEWAPPTIYSLMGGLFFAGLAFSILVMLLSRKKADFFQVVTFLVFGILGIRTARGSVWFGLVMAPIVAEHIAAIVQRYRKTTQKQGKSQGSGYLNVFLLVFVLLLGFISLPWFKNQLPFPAAKAGLISSETPIWATQALFEENPPGKLFNSMTFGSYLIWAAYPQYQVFVDSRIELFPKAVWLEYLRISNAEDDWESLLDKYGINTLMLSPAEQPGLVKAVESSDSWKLLYKDEVARIYIRTSGTQ